MLLVSSKLFRQSSKIYASCRYQNTTPSLSSILFPEPKPPSKSDVSTAPAPPPPKPTTKQQAQAVVSSAADAAVNVLGVGLGALNAVSNRITGLTSTVRKVPVEAQQAQDVVRAVSRETLEQRTKTLIRSVKSASSTLSQATRIEELSRCLLQQPDANYFTKKVCFSAIEVADRPPMCFFCSGTSCPLLTPCPSARISETGGR